MAKSADAADLKSADPQGLWGFKSPSGHHPNQCNFMCFTGLLEHPPSVTRVPMIYATSQVNSGSPCVSIRQCSDEALCCASLGNSRTSSGRNGWTIPE